MAHELDFSTGKAAIAFQGETPWHGLGAKMEPGMGFDVWLGAAGLDWEALRTKVQYTDTDGILHTAPQELIYRSDTKLSLGVVTERYKIVQPRDVIEFYRDLVGVNGWDIEVAGALDGGKRIWALAKTDAEFNVGKQFDVVGTYLLLATAFDGTMSTIGKFTSVRVVCQNTLTMCMRDGNKARVTVPHSRKFDARSVKEELGIYADATAKLQEEANAMAAVKVSDKEVRKFIFDVIAGEDADPDTISTKQQNILGNVYDLFNGGGRGSNFESAHGTAWGLVNCVTEYLDHHINSRTANNRLRSAWFGPAETMKQDAYNKAWAMVTGEKEAA